MQIGWLVWPRTQPRPAAWMAGRWLRARQLITHLIAATPGSRAKVGWFMSMCVEVCVHVHVHVRTHEQRHHLRLLRVDDGKKEKGKRTASVSSNRPAQFSSSVRKDKQEVRSSAANMFQTLSPIRHLASRSPCQASVRCVGNRSVLGSLTVACQVSSPEEKYILFTGFSVFPRAP
jgi:hypothetical protein